MEPTSVTVRETRLELSFKRREALVSWADSRGSHSVRLGGRALVGCAEQSAIGLVDPKVSRVHAELELDEGSVWLRDLSSSNGTWLDRVKVDRVRLFDDAAFRVGDTTLQLTFELKPGIVPLWPDDHLGGMLGRSPSMRALFMQIARCARSDASVLISGETGSGKELVADSLHTLSQRKGEFVVVDCGALPETLLESELFGHARGAFTGALEARAGAFEAADGGTVFLDEIAELPLAMQPKLLRVLESKTVRRLGQTRHAPVDVRIVAASHRDLEGMVARGEFREDLFFRLSVLPLRVPPLRERQEDVPLLLRHFLGQAHPLGEEAVRDLARRPWPGNVRELRTFAERVRALGLEQALSFRARPSPGPDGLRFPAVDIGVPFKEVREHWVSHLERVYLKALLARFGRDISVAAQTAGLDRSYIHRLIRKHGL